MKTEVEIKPAYRRITCTMEGRELHGKEATTAKVQLFAEYAYCVLAKAAAADPVAFRALFRHECKVYTEE